MLHWKGFSSSMWLRSCLRRLRALPCLSFTTSITGELALMVTKINKPKQPPDRMQVLVLREIFRVLKFCIAASNITRKLAYKIAQWTSFEVADLACFD